MLPESMDCKKCNSNFLLEKNERATGRFKCTICGHLNIFDPNNQVSSKQLHLIGNLEKYTCSSCGFEVKKESNFCSNCGANVSKTISERPKVQNRLTCIFCNNAINPEDKVCSHCGAKLRGEPSKINQMYSNPQYNMGRAAYIQDSRQYFIKFTGSAKEYFQIWIVNLVLTIFTFGIFAAWAKVRTRKYFYSNTWLNNHHFDYKANPKGIFIGYLILGFLVSGYYLTNFFNPIVSYVILFAGGIILPYLIYKSYRFFAYNSSYKNIRFSFHGTSGDSYITYLLIPLGIVFTLGLLFPFWDYSAKKFSLNNFGFGTLRSRFNGSAGTFYKHYIIIGLILFAYGVICILTITLLMYGNSEIVTSRSGVGFTIFYIGVLFIYQLGMTIYRQYLYSRLTNYSFGSTNFNNLQLNSTLRFGELFKIQIINLFAIVFSFGLLIPWAKIRRMRYILTNISLYTNLDLDNIKAYENEENNALGNVTTDYFELNIGL